MQQIHIDKRQNDQASVLNYNMDSLLLMENAGNALANFLQKQCQKFAKNNYIPNIIFLCGGGDNGADGLVASRILKSLMPDLCIQVILLQAPKSHLCKKQFTILSKLYQASNYNMSCSHLHTTKSNRMNNSFLDIITYYHFFTQQQTKINPLTLSANHKFTKDEFLTVLQEFLESISKLQNTNHQELIYCNMPLADSIQDSNNNAHTLFFDRRDIIQESFFISIFDMVSTFFPTLDNEKIYWQSYLYFQAFFHGTSLEWLHYRHLSLLFQSLSFSDIVVDCIFGSGFDNTKRTLESYNTYQWLKHDFQLCKALKVACDVPSGIPNQLGHEKDLCDILGCFDYTVSMGSISLCLLDSRVKDYIGKIKSGLLGIPKILYDKSYNLLAEKDIVSTTPTNWNLKSAFLLEKGDLKLPLRDTQNSHKGSYGTAYIIAGEMQGATLLAAKAAQSFGAGKTCIYTGISTSQSDNTNCEIIYTSELPHIDLDSLSCNKYAFCIGMGLKFDDEQYQILFDTIAQLCGWQDFNSLERTIKKQPRENLQCLDTNILSEHIHSLSRESKNIQYFSHLHNNFNAGHSDNITQKYLKSQSNIVTPFIFDADILYRQELSVFLPFLCNVVLTPHPKEFLALLKNLCIVEKNYTLELALRNIAFLALEFSQKLPNVVCLIKGANTTIVYQNTLYMHMIGNSNLAKGGSGDVLSGMIVSLMAQGYSHLDSCIQASLAHALASKKAIKKWNSYALTPLKLIESIENL